MEIVRDNVKINYRKPNFADAQLILGEINTGNMDLGDTSKNWEFIILSKVARCVDFLIQSIEVDEKKISYDDLMNEPEYSEALQAYSAEVISRVMDFSLKKKKQ